VLVEAIDIIFQAYLKRTKRTSLLFVTKLEEVLWKIVKFLANLLSLSDPMLV
jgi:hypothetical protein